MGFVKGRHLTSNIRRLLNVIMMPAEGREVEVVVAMDVEKAFDRMEWKYLWDILGRFGFGQEFVDWVWLFIRRRWQM